MNPFQILFGKIDSMGMSAVQGMYKVLAETLGPLFLAALTVYVVWWGYEMLFGRAQMTAGTFVWRFGRAFICYTLIVSWGSYQPLIATPLIEAPDGMATVVCKATGGTDCGGNGSSGSGVSQGLTDIWNGGLASATRITEEAGVTAVGLYLLALLIMAATCFLCAVAVTLLIFGKMTMFILLGIGPIVLCCALFNLTSRVVDGWITSLAGYALLPMIVYSVLGFMLTLLKDRVQEINQDGFLASVTTLAPFVLMCVVAIFLLKQSVAIALAIAGGGPRIDVPHPPLTRWMAAGARAGTQYLLRRMPRQPGTIADGGSAAARIGDGDAAAAQVRAAAANARR